MFRQFLLLGLLVSATISHTFAYEKKINHLSMVALANQNLIQHDKKGALDIMFEELTLRTGIAHEYAVTSSARGWRKFNRKNVHCIFPTHLNAEHTHQKQDVIHSTPFMKVSHYAFTLTERPLIQDAVQLHGKVVGILKDQHLTQMNHEFLESSVTMIEVSNAKNLAQLLASGRIDVAIHEYHEFKLVAQDIRLAMHFDMSQPINENWLGITCHNNAVAASYLKQINPHLIEIVRSGVHPYFEQLSMRY